MEENDDFELLFDGKLINLMFYYFKIEIICICTVVSMNDLLRTLTTSLCIRYLNDYLKKSLWVMRFFSVVPSNICVFSRFMCYF